MWSLKCHLVILSQWLHYSKLARVLGFITGSLRSGIYHYAEYQSTGKSNRSCFLNKWPVKVKSLSLSVPAENSCITVLMSAFCLRLSKIFTLFSWFQTFESLFWAEKQMETWNEMWNSWRSNENKMESGRFRRKSRMFEITQITDFPSNR